jgi:hypothetical protein
MKSRELIRWAILAYLVTLAMLIGTMCMMPASSDNAIANFAKFMITQVYPLFAIVPVLAVYSICVRRWQPILPAHHRLGNRLWFRHWSARRGMARWKPRRRCCTDDRLLFPGNPSYTEMGQTTEIPTISWSIFQ